LGRGGLWKPFVEDEDTQSYSYYLEDNNIPSSVFTPEQLDRWFRELHPSSYCSSADSEDASWTEASYQGELILRQTAWCVFADGCTCEYGYSDTWQPMLKATKMKSILNEITEAVSKIMGGGILLNSCNLNYYPRGGGVGFHADDEFLFDGLHREVSIISLSLCSPGPKGWGARKFQIRKKKEGGEEAADPKNNNDDDVQEILLGHGDLMTMEGMFQKYYLHSVWPGDSKEYEDHPLTQGERINLTWRTIVKHLDGSKECRGMVCPLSKENDS
jgi:hypothetical protein